MSNLTILRNVSKSKKGYMRFDVEQEGVVHTLEAMTWKNRTKLYGEDKLPEGLKNVFASGSEDYVVIAPTDFHYSGLISSNDTSLFEVIIDHMRGGSVPTDRLVINTDNYTAHVLDNYLWYREKGADAVHSNWIEGKIIVDFSWSEHKVPHELVKELNDVGYSIVTR